MAFTLSQATRRSAMTMSFENKRTVCAACRPWESNDSVSHFEIIAEDVLWTVIGTTSASGVYQSKQEIINKAFGPLLGQLDDGSMTRFVDRAAEGDKLFLVFGGAGHAGNGVGYDQTKCWPLVMRGGRIVEITVCLDTDLSRRVVG